MTSAFDGWKNWHPLRDARRRQPRVSKSVVRVSEPLEIRKLLTATLAPISTTGQLFAGKDTLVPLDGTSTTSAPITYTASSSNPAVTATVITGGRSLRMTVSGTDSAGAFSGQLTFRLFEDLAPQTTARIIALAESGFYNGLSFHRILNGFVAQGGDPAGNGSGGSGVRFDDEFSSKLTFTSRGLLAMANSGSDTNDSQFFIVDTDLTPAQLPQSLNFKHTIFGTLTSGFETFNRVMNVPVQPGSTGETSRPTNPVTMSNVQVFTDTAKGVLRVTAPEGTTGTTTITVSASDGAGTASRQTFDMTIVADTTNDRAFLGSVPAVVNTSRGTPAVITITGNDVERDALNFVIRDPNNTQGEGSAPTGVTTQIDVTPATTTTPASARITITPPAGFVGSIPLLVGVRDQTNRSGTGTLNSLTNFDTQRFTLNVTAPGSQPVNTVPTTAINGQPGAAVNLTGLSVADADAGTSNITVSLAAPQGTLAVSTSVTGGITASQLTGNNSGTVTINAPVAAINATLAATGGVALTPPASFTGSTQVTMTSSDGTNTDADPIPVLISSPTGAPVNTVPTTAITGQRGTTINLTGLSVADSNAGTTPLTVTLTSPQGTLAVNTSVTGGITASQLTGNNTGTVTLTAPLAAINATLAATGGVSVTPPASFTGSFQITMASNDGTTTDTDPFTVTVNASTNTANITLPTTTATVPRRPGAIAVSNGATFTLPTGATLAGTQLTVLLEAGGSRRDRLQLIQGQTADGELRVRRGKLFLNGVEIGRVDGGRRGQPLTISFNGAATAASAQTVMQNVGLDAARRAPTNQRSMSMTFRDAAGVFTTPTRRAINVT